MNRFPNIRPLFSLALLWLAASLLVSTLQTSILDMLDVPFLPVAILPMLMAYLLGRGKWPMHACWIFILSLGLGLTFLEATRTAYAVWQIFIHIPSLEMSIVCGFLTT